MQAAPPNPETATPAPVQNLPLVRSRPLVGAGRLYLCALASALLLWLSFFPVNWGFLAWFALAPLLALVRAECRPRQVLLAAWVGGLAYYVAAISWMRVAHISMVASWLVLSFYCSLYVPLAITLARRFERDLRLPLIATMPTLWIAFEYFRSWFGTGFSWYLLGHTQHDVPALLQLADLGGAFGLSFLIVAVNVVIFEALWWIPAVRQTFAGRYAAAPCCAASFAVQFALVAVALCAGWVYGEARIAEADFTPGPRVALLQANLDQRLKIEAERSVEARAKAQGVYRDLCLQASKAFPTPDMIVWPETSFPDGWVALAKGINLEGQPAEFRKSLASAQMPARMMAATSKTAVLLGANTVVLDYNQKLRRYNSALLLDPAGNDLGRYDKSHRVPFGEYVPFVDSLPFMKVFSPYDYDYSISPGVDKTRLKLGKYSFGVIICYEDTDPYVTREFAQTTTDGPPVDFLVNISNDGWFDGTQEHEQHLAISRFRAVETRRTLLRSVNMGISAAIDGNGRVLAPAKAMLAQGVQGWDINTSSWSLSMPVANWHQFKQVDAILTVDVPIDSRHSFYAATGDLLPNGCWIAIGLAIGAQFVRRFARRGEAVSAATP